MEDSKSVSAKPADEDEISLIDLFVVVLKHRRIIIVSTLCAVVLGTVAYFAYPAYSLAKAERNPVVEASMSLMVGTGFNGSLDAKEGSNFLMQSLTNPSSILGALRSAGYSQIEKTSIGGDADQSKVLYMIRRRLLENRSLNGSSLKETSRLYSTKFDNGIISVIFKSEDPEKAKSFLLALQDSINKDMNEYIRPLAVSTIESYEQLQAMRKTTESTPVDTAQGFRDYIAAKVFVNGISSPLIILQKPTVLVPELSLLAIQRDVLKKAIILVFGVFFMAVFAAFVLQAIDTVKKDPESMKKIHDALS